MTQPKPSAYLDKGAFGAFDLEVLSRKFQICYSKAHLFDLRNDQSDTWREELSLLNQIGALFLDSDGEAVFARQTNAFDEMESLECFEVEFMAPIYQFLNGGGTSSLYDICARQVANILQDESIAGLEPEDFISQIVPEAKLKQMREATPKELSRVSQSHAKSHRGATLHEILQRHPENGGELLGVFPAKPTGFSQINTAAMALGMLHLGRDKRINSPILDRSEQAARNGYADCLHIAFGLHCELFLTTDKATAQRHELLRAYWNINSITLLATSAPSA